MTTTRAAHLSDVASVFNGKTPARDDQREEGHPVLKIKDTDEYGRFRGQHESFVEPEFAAKHRDRCIVSGDTLILNAAHNASHVASKIYTAESAVDGALATGEWLIIRPNRSTLDAAFLSHWVRLPDTRLQLQNIVKGIHLYPKDVARLKFALPPLPEQRRIAAILDQADALRAKRRAALAQLDEMAQAIFAEMFGLLGTTRHQRSMVSLGKVCDVRDGTHDSPKYVSENGFPLVTSKNVTGGGIDLSTASLISEEDYRQISKRSKVDRGDILLPMIGTIGSPVIVDQDPQFAIKNVALIKFLPTSPTAKYVRAALQSSYFLDFVAERNRGGTQKFISLGDIRSFSLPLPSHQAQREFNERIEAAEGVAARFSQSQRDLDTLFASLQHRAFNGEL